MKTLLLLFLLLCGVNNILAQTNAGFVINGISSNTAEPSKPSKRTYPEFQFGIQLEGGTQYLLYEDFATQYAFLLFTECDLSRQFALTGGLHFANNVLYASEDKPSLSTVGVMLGLQYRPFRYKFGWINASIIRSAISSSLSPTFTNNSNYLHTIRISATTNIRIQSVMLRLEAGRNIGLEKKAVLNGESISPQSFFIGLGIYFKNSRNN